VSFGAISVVYAKELAAGSALAHGVCIFLTAFWTLRLVAATFVFDVRPYIRTAALRLGYHATSVVFIFLPVVYFMAALKGGGR
jgi:hypothetical protein